MATYTASDFCQGHGGGRDCTYYPEADGCYEHGYDFEHGVISYCDGTCTEGREHYNRYLRVELGRELEASATEITLAAWGQGISYEVTFTGPNAEDHALSYMVAKAGLHFEDVYDRPFSYDAFPRVADALHPLCHHTMSLHLCMDPIGPNHFGTREQEMAGNW